MAAGYIILTEMSRGKRRSRLHFIQDDKTEDQP
jgi:hypothetical protein